MSTPTIGQRTMCAPIPIEISRRFRVGVVRDLSDFQKIVAIRAAIFMNEQDCPYEEEFDGNDIAGTHLLLFEGDRPIGTLRLRWFSDFGKLERICILPAWRNSGAVKLLVAHAFELASQKGYAVLIGHIQARLWPMWKTVVKCKLRENRPTFSFSDYEYVEIEIPLAKHPRSVHFQSNPYRLIRPEGDWDRPGILESGISASNDVWAA